MSIKITIPNSSSDVLTFGSGNTPTAAQIAGIDSGSSNGQLALYTTASGTSTERVRVDASGNVGVGTSSPTYRLEVATAGQAVLQIKAGTTTDDSILGFGDSAANLQGRINYSHNGDSMAFYTNGSQKALIDSSGNLLVGTTSTGPFTGRVTLSGNSGTTNWSVGPYSGNAGGFMVCANASYGVYLPATTSTSWATASDERIKTALEPIENAAEKVSTLRAVTGKYKTDENGPRKPFLIAQDVLAVFPEAVDTSNPERYGIAYSEMIPLLVAAIKEQQAIITSLTDRITALEGATS